MVCKSKQMDQFQVSAAALFCSAMLLLTLLWGTTISSEKTTTQRPASRRRAVASASRTCSGSAAHTRRSAPTGPFGSPATPLVRLSSKTKYRILDISYGERSFRVTNDIELSNGTCDIELRVNASSVCFIYKAGQKPFSVNASSDLCLVPFSISPTNQELFFLHGCTDLQARPPLPMWATVNWKNDGTNMSTTFNTFA